MGNTVEISGAATFDGRAPAYNNPDSVIVDPGSTLTLRGTIINTGSITLEGNRQFDDINGLTVVPSTLQITGDVNLQGGGVLTLQDNLDSDNLRSSLFYNVIEGAASGAVLRNVDNTISGVGKIGGSGLTLVNQKNGVIDVVLYDGLTIDTGVNTVVNAGLMEATAPTFLWLRSTVNNSGTILASDGIVNLVNVGGTGGTIEADGYGTIGIAGVVNTAGGLLKTVGPNARIQLEGTLTGALTIALGTQILVSQSGIFDGRAPAFHNTATVTVDGNLRLRGTIINTNSITLEGSSPPDGGVIYTLALAAADNSMLVASHLLIDGNVSLQGAGTVTLLDDGAGSAIAGVGTAAVLRNVGNTIAGSGGIGGGGLTFINLENGVIDATSSGLVVDTGSNAILNAGLMEATDGGTLDIKSAVGGSGGTIQAGDGSTVVIEGLVNTAAALKSVGAGKIELSGGVLTGAVRIADGTQIEVGPGGGTFDGRAPAFRNTAEVQVGAGRTLTLRGNIVNTGSITLASPDSNGAPGLLQIDGNVTLQGHGLVTLQAPSSNFANDFSLIDSARTTALFGYAPGSPDRAGLYEINESNAALDFLTTISPLPSPGGMGFLGGSLYMLDRLNIEPGGFTVDYGTVDIHTGTFTPVGLQSSPNWVGFAADRQDGVFYTVDYNHEQLLRVTPGGSIEAIGASLGRDLRGLTYDDIHGIIYAADYYSGVPNLYRIDPHTGAATLVGSLGFPAATGGGDIPLAYDDTTGVLYASNAVADALYTVDTTTGLATEIGFHGEPIATLAFVDVSQDSALRNVDNTIAGGGLIGGKYSNFALINQKDGVIDASLSAPGSSLEIDTGATTVANAGLMEATGGGSLDIKSAINSSGTITALGAGSAVHVEAAIANTGSLVADGGSIVTNATVSGGGKATITNNGSIEFGGATLEHVSFAGAGKLLLDAAASFHGDVTGFGANDAIGFGDISFGANTTLAFISNMAGTGGLLRVSDSTHNAAITMVGSYTTASFAKQDDNGHLSVGFAPPAAI